MKKYIINIIFLFTCFFCIKNSIYADEIDISSKNAILINLNDDSVLYEKSADDKVNIASLTKIMTALVAIENIDDYNKQIIVDSNIVNSIPYDYSKAKFLGGEVVTYNDLLYGIILPSGADATNLIAINISGSIPSFVELMNKKAEELKLNNTHFENTIGIEADEHYSTVKDVANLLKYAIKNPKFREVFTKNQYKTSNEKHEFSGPVKRAKDYEMDYVIGAKTGYTSPAGLCLATYSKHDGVEYISVTTGASEDNKLQNFLDTDKIYNYYFDNYNYLNIINKGDKIESIKTIYLEEYEIVSPETVSLYLNKNITKNDLKYTYKGKKEIDKTISKGDTIGVYEVSYNNKTLYSMDVYSPVSPKFKASLYLKNNIIVLSLMGFVTILFFFVIIKRKKIFKY